MLHLLSQSIVQKIVHDKNCFLENVSIESRKNNRQNDFVPIPPQDLWVDHQD